MATLPSKALGQALTADELKAVPAELERNLIRGVPKFGMNQPLGTSAADRYQVESGYEKYAKKYPFQGMAGLSNQGKVQEYQVPTGKTYKGIPLVAVYGSSGSLQHLTFPEGQFLRIDPNNPNVISRPKINKSGEITDYGIGVQGDPFDSGFGGFLGDLASDFGPMALAALGANYFAPAAGAAGGSAGAVAPGALNPYAAQAAGAYGGSTAAAQAAAAGNLAGIQGASAAQNALTQQAVNNLGLTFGQGVPTATPDQIFRQDANQIADLKSEGTGSPFSAPTGQGGADLAAKLAPEATGSADKAAIFGSASTTSGGYGAAASPAELASGTGLLSSLGNIGSSALDFAKANPSLTGSLLGAGVSALGALNAPKSQTATTSIDPQIKAEYLANLERAKQTAAALEARQIAQPGQMYTDAEQKLYNLGMTPFGAADIERFYNPYQEQVVQGALSDIERTRQMQEQENMARATASRAFGGSRQGVVSGMTNEAALRQSATTGAQLRSAGFNTAANLGLAARPMDIAGLQTSLGLGATRTALEQARLDALRNLGSERLQLTSGALGIGIPNLGSSSTQPLYSSTAGSALSGGLTGAYIGSLLGKA